MELRKEPSIVSLLVGLASVVLIVAGVKAMSDLLSPILLSLFIVLVTSPIMSWLKRRGAPAWLAYTLVLLGVITIGAFVILFLATSLNELTDALPTYASGLSTQVDALRQWLNNRGITSEYIQSLELFQPEQLLGLSFSIVSVLLNSVSNIGLTLLIFIYMLASAPAFSAQLRKGLGSHSSMLGRFQEFSNSMSTYLLIKGWLGALTAIAQMVLMWAFGTDFVVLWGVLSFFLNFVPTIGFYIALLPPLLIVVLKLGFLKGAIFGLLYVLINNFFDIAIAPRYLAKGLDLSTLMSFLAVVIWTWILGPIGAFMALPLTVMVKTLLLESFPQTQLVAKLLSAGDDSTSA